MIFANIKTTIIPNSRFLLFFPQKEECFLNAKKTMDLPSLPPKKKQKDSADTPPPKTPQAQDLPPTPDPTRYGDWEKGGKCIDF